MTLFDVPSYILRGRVNVVEFINNSILKLTTHIILLLLL